MPERIDLARADDPRDVVHRAVACLARGGVVVLPTEAEYALAASALHPGAVGRLQQMQGNGALGTWPIPLALKGADEAADWVPGLSALARRLSRRAWPGAVTLVLDGGVERGLARRLAPEVSSAITPGPVLALRAPSHPAVREVLRLISGPLALADFHLAGRPVATTPADLDDLDGPDLILDDGPTHLGAAATIVRVVADTWAVESLGAVDERALTRMAGTILLFVCTGNTCRSPMAEALCKRMLAERLGCTVEDLEVRGYVILSAGLAAARGHRANHDAVEAVRVRGASLQGHSSRQATPELVAQADLVLTMTEDHRYALLSQLPELADRIRLLDPRGDDIPDPIGMDRDTYHYTAEVIEAHLVNLMAELGL